MARMPVLKTERLWIRPFMMDDLVDVHRLLDLEMGHADPDDAGGEALAHRAQWLQWTVLNYEQLADLHQPPYGDRALILVRTGHLIGACGFVPCLGPFEQLPGFYPGTKGGGPGPWSAEVDLFYAMGWWNRIEK